MRLSRLPLLLAALLILAGRAEAQFRPTESVPGEQFHVEMGMMFWTPTPQIGISTGGLGPLGETEVDFVKEFSLPDERFTEFKSTLKGGKHKLRVSKLAVNYQQAVRLDRAITFGGRTFNVNADATTDISWDLWRVGYEYDFVSRSRGLIGFVAEVQHNRVAADVRATTASETEISLSEASAAIPTLGFLTRVYPHETISVTFEYTGFKMPGFWRNRLPENLRAEGIVADFDLSGVVSFTRFLGFQAGYRSVKTDYSVEGTSANMALKGPYFGGIVRF